MNLTAKIKQGWVSRILSDLSVRTISVICKLTSFRYDCNFSNVGKEVSVIFTCIHFGQMWYDILLTPAKPVKA